MFSALIIYFFFPHLRNNHKAKFLHPIMIGFSVLMFIAGQLLIPFLPKFTPIVLGYVSNIPVEDVIKLTNDERQKVGLPALEIDPDLTQAAMSKANYMFAKNYWAHTAPDGTEPWKFVTESGYKYRYAGENLARDFTTSEATVKAWMASPTHKENLLSGRYRDVGVAVVKGELNGVQTTLIVQFFGTKMSQVSKVEPVEYKPAIQNPSVLESKITNLIDEKKNLILSPLAATKHIAFFLVSLFFLIFSIDMIIVKHKNIARISSKSLAHILFFGMILGVVYISRVGSII